MPMNKSQDYWKGFADGQRDIEAQMDVEEDSINPNNFIHSLDLFSDWLMQILEKNSITDLDDEGSPIGKNYNQSTIATIAGAFAYSNLLKAVSSAIFLLH